MAKYMRRFKVIPAAVLLLFGATICRSAAAAGTQLQRAADGIQALQRWYDPATGLYRTTGWWNSANALTVVIDYARLTKSDPYNLQIANTFVAAQNKGFGFLNRYYDDEGWWALAWIDAYDLTGNRAYLAMAKSIFADMAGGWDDTCGGGIWWNKDRRYKNAIANELFFSVAAHLANRDSSSSAEYGGWASREWNWFLHSGMMNDQNLINDGLTAGQGQTAGERCRNNGQTTWSYNQGVVLGGLAEFSKFDSDPSLLRIAQEIATAAITRLVDKAGVLHDPCEPGCGADGVQFKGIFVRNLTALDQVQPEAAYRSFIITNANAAWDKSRGPGNQFGQVWSGPFDAPDAGSQSSALDAIISAAYLERRR